MGRGEVSDAWGSPMQTDWVHLPQSPISRRPEQVRGSIRAEDGEVTMSIELNEDDQMEDMYTASDNDRRQDEEVSRRRKRHCRRSNSPQLKIPVLVNQLFASPGRTLRQRDEDRIVSGDNSQETPSPQLIAEGTYQEKSNCFSFKLESPSTDSENEVKYAKKITKKPVLYNAKARRVMYDEIFSLLLPG